MQEAAPELEARQRRELARYRLFASLLLVVVAAVLLGLRWSGLQGFWIGLVWAAAEAALVGGLADWFAVTALFRRPLGLPIPHTAIIPRNKDRIGEGLGRFIERNFLAPELVARKLASLGPAARLAGWLSEPANAAGAADRFLAALPYALNALQDREVRVFVGQALERQLAAVEAAPLAGRVLALLTAAGHHRVVFDQAVAALRTFLETREQAVYAAVAERSRWWIPKKIDRKIAEALLTAVLEVLDEIADENHVLRQRFDRWLQDAVRALQEDPFLREKGEALKHELIDNSEVQRYLASVWDRLRAAILADAAATPSALRQAISDGLQSIGRSLARDSAMQARLDRRIEELVVGAVVPYRSEIGRFMAEVVRSWDARTVTDRLELAVGRDLQYIRVNGTVVGALVGAGLYLLFTLT